jgi:hypothetical protein
LDYIDYIDTFKVNRQLNSNLTFAMLLFHAL